MKLTPVLLLAFILLSPSMIFIPAEVGDIVLIQTNVQLSPGALVQRDVIFVPFALYQVEANTTPINSNLPAGEEVVMIRIQPYEGSGGSGIPIRSDSHPYNDTFMPQSVSYNVEIENFDDVNTYWVNLTITQIDDPLNFTIPTEGSGSDITIVFFGFTVLPLLGLLIFVFLKQRSATRQQT